MNYIIANNKHQYLSKNEQGQFILVYQKNRAMKMTKSKAQNILPCLPKRWKNYHLKIVSVPESVKQDHSDSTKCESLKSDDLKVKELIKYEDIDSISEEVKTMLSSINDTSLKVQKKLDTLSIDLSNADKARNDLEHKIEFAEKANACEGWYYFSMLREVLQKRRKIKNDIAYLQKILDTTIKGCGDGSLENFIYSMENRKYTARILGENFNG